MKVLVLGREHPMLSKLGPEIVAQGEVVVRRSQAEDLAPELVDLFAESDHATGDPLGDDELLVRAYAG